MNKIIKLSLAMSLIGSIYSCSQKPSTIEKPTFPQLIQKVTVKDSITQVQKSKMEFAEQETTIQSNPNGTEKLTFRFKLPQSFKTQNITVGDIKFLKLSLTGVGISSPIENVEGFVSVSNGGGIATINNVPKGINRVVTATGYDANQVAIPAAVGKGFYSSDTSSVNVTITIGRRFLAAGLVLEQLLTSSPGTAAKLDMNQLQAKLDPLLYGSPIVGTTFNSDPTQINVPAIVASLQSSGNLPEINNQIIASTVTVPVTVTTANGANFAENVSLIINDPESPALTINTGTGVPATVNVTNVSPGTWSIIAKNTSDGNSKAVGSVTVDMNGNATVTGGTVGNPLTMPSAIASIAAITDPTTQTKLRSFWSGEGNTNDTGPNAIT